MCHYARQILKGLISNYCQKLGHRIGIEAITLDHLELQNQVWFTS